MERVMQLVSHPDGMHARPAARLVALAQKYGCSIVLCCRGKMADAKVLHEVLALRVQCGDTVEVRCEGVDEVLAAREMAAYMALTLEE